MARSTVLLYNWVILILVVIGTISSLADPTVLVTGFIIGLLCVANIMYINKTKEK